MKPARSPHTTGLLPSRRTSASTSSSTSGSVTTVRTISTKLCTGAGLKKWTPITRPGWRLAVEISVTLRLEVLVARIVSGFTIPSRSRKIDFFTSTDSTTASTTKSASARSFRLVENETRLTSSAWSSSLSLPRLTARAVECSRCWRPRSTASSFTSTPSTEKPLRANTSAMPAPIVPSPTTPMVAKSRVPVGVSDVVLVMARILPRVRRASPARFLTRPWPDRNRIVSRGTLSALNLGSLVRRWSMRGRFVVAASLICLALLTASCSGSGSSSEAPPAVVHPPPAVKIGGPSSGAVDPVARGPFVIEGAQSGGTVTVLTHDGLAGTLDPSGAHQRDMVSLLSGLVTRSLTQYRYDPQTRQMLLVPDLATDLGRHNDDYTKWEYTLRRGVRFEDGTPVTPRDVVRGIHRCAARSFPTSPCRSHKPIVSVTVARRHALRFRFAHPFPDLPYLVAAPAIGPVPRGTSLANGPYARHPLATGPYQLERYRRGHVLVLTRNPEWDPRTDPARTAYPDRYVVRSGVPSADIARVLADDTGQGTTTVTYDAVPVTPADRHRWRQRRLALGATPCTTYLALDDRTVAGPKVRRALVLAYPYRAVLRAEGLVTGVTAVPATNLLPPGIPGRTSLTVAGHPGFSTQPGAARRLLVRAGAVGTPLRFHDDPDDPVSRRTRGALVRSLRAAGFDPEPVRGAPGDLRTVTRCGAWPTGSEWLRPVYGPSGLDLPAFEHRVRTIDRLPLDQMAEKWNALDRDILRHRQLIVPLWYGGVAMQHGSRVRGMADDTVLGMPTWKSLWVAR